MLINITNKPNLYGGEDVNSEIVIVDYQELIERLRKAVISPFDLGPVADAIESLLAENERLKAELAKYCDAPVVAWQWLDTANFRSKLPKNADRSEWNQLIVKLGEMK